MRTPPRSGSFRGPGLAALTLLVLAAGCGGDGGGNEPDVTVTLSPTSVSLFVGETASLSASVSGGSGGSVSFTSSDNQVAMVSQSGTVTAVGVGSATITASASGASATASVTVNASSISVTPAGLELEVGQTGQLTATITGGVGLSATWSSSDESVATVDATGLVTAEAVGTATISAVVTGQTGVEATADVTVTETPPALYLESLETLDGDPLDVNDVSGVFVANLTVEGPPGMTGTIEVRLGDVLVASQEITLSAGAPSAGPLRGVQGEVGMSVSTITTELVNATPVARTINDLTSLSPGIVVDGTTTPATARGGGSIPSVNLRNPPMIYLDGVPVGGTVVGQGGATYNTGDGQFTGRFVYFDESPAPVESVEVVADPVGTVYNGSALGGVVNFIIRSDLGAPSGIEGYAGPVSFPSASAVLIDASTVNLVVANRYADYLGSGLDVKAEWNWDAADPTYGADLTYGANFWVGAEIDFDAWARANAGYDPSLLTDQGSGIDYSQWVAGPDPFDSALPPVVTGGDLAQTAGYSNYLRLDFYDFAGLRGDRIVRDGSGQPLAFGVDLDNPDLSLKVGATYIKDFAVNPDPAWSIGGELDDPVDPGVGGASGPYLDGFDLRLQWNYDGVTDEQGCVTGTFSEGACGFLRLNTPLSLGFKPDFSGGAGEYTASLRGFDMAWNPSNTLMTHFVYDPEPPELGDLDWDPDQLSIGARLEVSWDLTDNLKLTYGAFGNTYDGRDEVYLSNFAILSRAFDGTFPTTTQLNGALDPVLQAIQGTLADPPYSPTGTWHPLNGLRWGAKDVGHNLTVRGLDITDISTPTGTHTSVDWVHGVVGEPKVCIDLGGGCPGVPTSADYTLEALIPGGSGGDPFDLDWAQLFALVELDNSVKIAVPVTGRANYSIQDMGGYRRATATATFDPSMAPLDEGTYDFFWLTKDDEDLGTISNPFQVQITVSKNFLGPSRPGPRPRR